MQSKAWVGLARLPLNRTGKQALGGEAGLLRLVAAAAGRAEPAHPVVRAASSAPDQARDPQQALAGLPRVDAQPRRQRRAPGVLQQPPPAVGGDGLRAPTRQAWK